MVFHQVKKTSLEEHLVVHTFKAFLQFKIFFSKYGCKKLDFLGSVYVIPGHPGAPPAVRPCLRGGGEEGDGRHQEVNVLAGPPGVQARAIFTLTTCFLQCNFFF